MSFSLAGASAAAFKNGYEISPILFSGGIAANLPGGLLPIISILQPGFAHFRPLPGGTLSATEIGRYPLANQAIAGNALIAKPLRLSMLMAAPANGVGGLITKLVVMTTLKSVIDQHTALGGLYVVATPAYIYENGISGDLTDVTPEGAKVQEMWQWDFEFPLITLQQAQMAQNNMMAKISGGVQTDGSLSGPNSTVGSQVGGAAPSAVPGAQGLVGATVQGAPSITTPIQPGGAPSTGTSGVL
jgi:hypothetical protein